MFVKLHEAFGHIHYIDDVHHYYNMNNRERLISVTQLIKKYRKPFPRDYMSKRKAKEYGTSQKNVLEMWDNKSLRGAARGSILHDYLENKWFNKEFNINYSNYISDDLITNEFLSKQKKIMNMALNFYKDHKHIIPIRTELIVGNDKIAGQVDFFGYNLETDSYVLLDYKTDKKIDYDNEYQAFLKPLSHLRDCEYNKYSLQIKLYESLLKCVVEDINEKFIVWFNADNNNYELIKIKNLTDEANTILSNL